MDPTPNARAAAVTSGRSHHGRARYKLDDSALSQYTYFLDDGTIDKLIVFWDGDGEDAPVMLMTGKVFGGAMLMRRSPRRR